MVMDAGLNDTGPDGAASDTAGKDGGKFAGTGPHGGSAPDMHKLAQDWITLWQSELAAMAADPEIRESWQTVAMLWAGTMASMLRGMPRDQNPYRHDSTPGRPGAADAPRAAAAPVAPDSRDAEIERLARHVAALERRLAELERDGGPPSRPKVDPKPRSARPPRR